MRTSGFMGLVWLALAAGLTSCSSGGAVLAGLAQPAIADETRLKADPPRPFGLFGATVVAEEGILAAFEPGSSSDRPRVLVFEEGPDGWHRSLEIVAPDGEGHGFGQGLALAGGWLAVGSPESAPAGAVYLYPLRAPSEPVVLRPSGEGDFGSLLASDGDVLAVAGSSEGGSFVELFTAESGEWRLLGRIDSIPSSSSTVSAMDLASDWLAVGVAGATEGEPGQVHLYHQHQTTGQWLLSTTLSKSGADRFGRSLDLDGDRLLLGAPNVHGRAFAQVYVHRSGEWLLEDELLTEPSGGAGHFGAAVTWTGSGLAVGAPTEGGRGTVHLFSSADDEWRHEATLRPASGGEADSFGIALAHAGGTLVVGATGDDGHEPDSGAVYLYRLTQASSVAQEGTR